MVSGIFKLSQHNRLLLQNTRTYIPQQDILGWREIDETGAITQSTGYCGPNFLSTLLVHGVLYEVALSNFVLLVLTIFCRHFSDVEKNSIFVTIYDPDIGMK